jgi:hypothetical protein
VSLRDFAQPLSGNADSISLAKAPFPCQESDCAWSDLVSSTGADHELASKKPSLVLDILETFYVGGSTREASTSLLGEQTQVGVQAFLAPPRSRILG